MNFRIWVGVSVLVSCGLSILPYFYVLSYGLGFEPYNALGVDYIFMWGSPIPVNFFQFTPLLTLVATLVLGICALIFVMSGGALKALAFLGSLMFAYQGSHLLVGFVKFFLTARKTGHDLAQLSPMLAMTVIGYCVLLLFQREWTMQASVSVDPVVATPIQRFYSYAIDVAIFLTLVASIHLEMLPYEWLVLIVLYILYFAVFERVFLLTPGKLLLNTRVRMQNGTVPDESAIIRRTLARLIPLEPLSCFDGHGWHDEISKTTVVRYP
ncbi:RDD family protein [Parachryseolinea silvisoli]|jgi:hypothetical protein|uniref:RDD family protein n=1 Tax=Parachryseolinea silvisoli TaxID=2873601 RepID=UPI002265ECBD|nr:RDD family protein [Parachryseolinea silvisoli]MCD9018639.1 RDD family protein [Parachryseolinea silvisoli]